jgi:hypothetical protein
MCSAVKCLKTNKDLHAWINISISFNMSALGQNKTVTFLFRQHILEMQTNLNRKYWNVFSLEMLFGD